MKRCASEIDVHELVDSEESHIDKHSTGFHRIYVESEKWRRRESKRKHRRKANLETKKNSALW